MRKFLLLAPLLSTLGLVSACAPSGPTTATTRNPVLGDPGPLPGAASGPGRPTAGDLARSDRQPPGTMNGNQPDRAAAAGGAR